MKKTLIISTALALTCFFTSSQLNARKYPHQGAKIEISLPDNWIIETPDQDTLQASSDNNQIGLMFMVQAKHSNLNRLFLVVQDGQKRSKSNQKKIKSIFKKEIKIALGSAIRNFNLKNQSIVLTKLKKKKLSMIKLNGSGLIGDEKVKITIRLVKTTNQRILLVFGVFRGKTSVKQLKANQLKVKKIFKSLQSL